MSGPLVSWRSAATADSKPLIKTPYPGTGRIVDDELTHLIATIGENLVLRRSTRLAVGQGGVFSYVHNALGPGLGKIGVIVALESGVSAERARRSRTAAGDARRGREPALSRHRLGAGGGT